MNNENTHNHLRSFFLPKNREIMKTHEVSNVSPTRCRVTLRPMYGTRSTRSKKESLDGAFSLSLSLSFLSLSLDLIRHAVRRFFSLLRVEQIVPGSETRPVSNGRRRGRHSLSLSLCRVESRRKITDAPFRRITRIPDNRGNGNISRFE